MARRKATKVVRSLKIVVFQDDDWLCAQYVDYDLAAQAKTLPALYKAVDKVTRSHIEVRRRHGLEPFKDLPPAPARFRAMFEQSKVPRLTQLVAVHLDDFVVSPQ